VILACLIPPYGFAFSLERCRLEDTTIRAAGAQRDRIEQRPRRVRKAAVMTTRSRSAAAAPELGPGNDPAMVNATLEETPNRFVKISGTK
jgi:hypothetical protein